MVKLDTSKAFMKYGNEGKFRKVSEFTIDGMTLGELYADWKNTKAVLVDLLEQLKGHYIVKEDTSYIIEIEGELKRVPRLNVLKDVDTKLPLDFYEVKDGKIVVNKRKVASL